MRRFRPVWACGLAAVTVPALQLREPTRSTPEKGPGRWRLWRRSAPTTCPAVMCFDRDWDLRHAPEGMKCQGDTKVIILIRHGQYENRGGPGYGRLTAKGKEQARMAGQHLVARLRADPALKRGLRSVTSSALDRAIETATLIEKELLEEVAWVDVDRASLPEGMSLQFVSSHGSDAEYLVDVPAPVVIDDPKNMLQPRVEVRSGSRLRVSAAVAEPTATTLSAACTGESCVSVYQPLQEQRRPDESMFGEFECSGCKQVVTQGDIHWSDDAEKTGVGFCDKCFAAGPKHKRLKDDDSLSRITRGVPYPALRKPNDPNLNESLVDCASVLAPDDPLYPEFGIRTADGLKDHEQVETAFRTYFFRCVNHNALERSKRKDVLPFAFVSKSGEECLRHLTQAEFDAVEIQDGGNCPWIWDDKASKRVDGPFTLQRIGDEVVADKTVADMRKLVSKAQLPPKPEKQVEIIVAHQNVIRYLFLRSMQFDTTMWLNLGGSNCTMTQLRINRRGDVICDFFADHGSVLPISHYTFNNHPDV